MLDKLISTLRPDDPDAEAVDAYFDTIHYQWLDKVSLIIERWREGEIGSLAEYDLRPVMWQLLLTDRIPDNLRLVRNIHIHADLGGSLGACRTQIVATTERDYLKCTDLMICSDAAR